MEDLSHLYSDPVSALVPTGQAGGNVPHGNRAMTAPGSAPPGADESAAQPAPDVDATAHSERTVTHGDALGLRGGKPLLVRGGWNDMGGGPAPRRQP